MARLLTVNFESFPIRGAFRISRGAKTEARVVVAEVSEGSFRGRGECVPYARYGESVEGVMALLETQAAAVAAGLDREALRRAMPAGAARNALDAALWDLEAKQAGRPAWQIAGLAPPQPLTTCYTLSVDTPEAMAEAAEKAAHLPLLKLKLTGDGDLERVAAVRRAAPKARLVADANEAWRVENYRAFAGPMAELGVEMIEQPFPAGRDALLDGLPRPVPVGADESCHGLDTFAALKGRYDVVNLKLDKTGGLTEALVLKAAAEAMGFRVMVGSMVGTSLGTAPAVLLGQGAAYVDLDGPLLLARDREPGLRFDGARVFPPEPVLWG